MKIFVKAKPGAKNSKIEKIDDSHFDIAVKESPKEGRANQAIIKALAKYLNIPRASIKLKSGTTSKTKIFEVSEI